MFTPQIKPDPPHTTYTACVAVDLTAPAPLPGLSGHMTWARHSDVMLPSPRSVLEALGSTGPWFTVCLEGASLV